MRNPDGTYDVPGIGPVPEQYIPDHLLEAPPPANDLYNQDAVAPPPGPDQRLAMTDAERQEVIARSIENAQAAGKTPPSRPATATDAPAPAPYSIQLGQDYPSQIAEGAKGVVKEAVNPSFNSVPSNPEPAPAPAKPTGKLPEDVQLSAPPTGETEGGKKEAPADPALANFLLGYMHGTPPTVIPEHPAKTAESWTQHDLKAPPGTTTETKELPDDAIPVWRDVQVGTKGGKPVYEKKLVFQTVNSGPELTAWQKGEKVGDTVVPPKSTNVSNWAPEYSSATQETPNDVITAGAKARADDSAQEALETEEFNARLKASRDMGVADVYQGQAQREQKSVEDLRTRQAQDQANVDKARADFQNTLSHISRIAVEGPPEPELGRKLLMGIAQGLLYAGAAAAGQQQPHIDWIGQQIRLDVEKQRMQLEAGVHIAGLKLNALQTLQQHIQSPEAAQHALAMADYLATVHMGDSMIKQNSSQELIDNWQTMRAQLQAKADKEHELSTEAEHITQTQRIPRTVTQGKAGGYQGLREAAKALFKEPKAQDEAVAHWAAQIGRGEAPSMPDQIGGDGMNMRAKETKLYNIDKAKSQLNPRITGYSGVAYLPGHEKLAQQAITAQNDGQNVVDLFDDIRDQYSRFGAKSFDRTTVAKIDNALMNLEAKLLKASNEGNTEIKVDMQKIRSGREYLQHMSIADAPAIVDYAEKMAVEMMRSLVPLDQMTRTYRGDDYVRDNAKEAKKVRR